MTRDADTLIRTITWAAAQQEISAQNCQANATQTTGTDRRMWKNRAHKHNYAAEQLRQIVERNQP